MDVSGTEKPVNTHAHATIADQEPTQESAPTGAVVDPPVRDWVIVHPNTLLDEARKSVLAATVEQPITWVESEMRSGNYIVVGVGKSPQETLVLQKQLNYTGVPLDQVGPTNERDSWAALGCLAGSTFFLLLISSTWWYAATYLMNLYKAPRHFWVELELIILGFFGSGIVIFGAMAAVVAAAAAPVTRRWWRRMTPLQRQDLVKLRRPSAASPLAINLSGLSATLLIGIVLQICVSAALIAVGTNPMVSVAAPTRVLVEISAIGGLLILFCIGVFAWGLSDWRRVMKRDRVVVEKVGAAWAAWHHDQATANRSPEMERSWQAVFSMRKQLHQSTFPETAPEAWQTLRELERGLLDLGEKSAHEHADQLQNHHQRLQTLRKQIDSRGSSRVDLGREARSVDLRQTLGRLFTSEETSPGAVNSAQSDEKKDA